MRYCAKEDNENLLVEKRCVNQTIVKNRARQAGIGLNFLKTGSGSKLALWKCLATSAPQCSVAPVLLLHGVTYSSMSVFDLKVPGKNRRDFSFIAQLSDAGISTFALDYSGYGLSESDQSVMTIEDHVKQVRTAIREIRKLTSCAPLVVGWSWSGHVVARLGELVGKDEIAGIVVWGAQWGGGPEGRPDFLKKMQLPEKLRRVNSISHAGADFRTPEFFEQKTKNAFIDWALFLDPSSPTLGLTELVQSMPLFDAAKIRVPTLILHGSNDHAVVENDISAMMEAITIPGSRRIVIDGGDHNAQFNHCRHEFVKHIADYSREKFAGGS